MAWSITGKSTEFCNCNVACPCWLGPEGEPDQGWCDGVVAFDIVEGRSDGVNLSGTKVVFHGEWPGNFFGGNGVARLYIDGGASEEQRRELEGIFTGRKGGHLEGLFGAVISKWLQTKFTDVAMDWGDKPSVKVADIGEATLTPFVDGTGRPTMIEGSAAQAAFKFPAVQIASSKGTRWADPELREWQGDSGTLHQFSWAS